MKIKYSKRELYNDNIRLRKELDIANARTIELVIVMEQQNKRIDKINTENHKIMEELQNGTN